MVDFPAPFGPRKPVTVPGRRLQCAVFLHATGKLRFSHCEMAESGKVRFVFNDPDGLGDQIELEFDCGASVPATSLFASQKYLRRKLSEALNRKNGEFIHGYTR